MQALKPVRRRKRFGSSIVEVAAGLFLLVPVAIFLTDIMAVVMVQTANDALAKHAARAAAEKTDAATAQQAANDIIATFPASNLANNPSIIVFQYTNDPAAGISQVYVRTQLVCNFPFPIPFNDAAGKQMLFVAEATEPIVGLLPPS
jgi:hypothetical protein